MSQQSLQTDLETGNSTGQDLVDDIEANAVKSDANFTDLYGGNNTVEIGLTASATQTQGQGALTAFRNYVDTVATPGDVRTLKSMAVGDSQYVENRGANTLSLYPASGQNLGEGLNTLTTLYPGEFVLAVCEEANVINLKKSRGSVSVNFITGSETLPAHEMYNFVHYVTATATVALPPVAEGMNAVFHTVGAIAVSIDPNASDLIVLDGTALDDGDKITNASTAGDSAALSYYNATGFYASTNGWTDGGV